MSHVTDYLWIRLYQDENEICSNLKKFCREGWSNKHSLKFALPSYWQYRGEITVQQSILIKGDRVTVPSTLRLDVLDKIHTGHQGIQKCRERAKSGVWWPDLSKQIKDLFKDSNLHQSSWTDDFIETAGTSMAERWHRVIRLERLRVRTVCRLLFSLLWDRSTPKVNFTRSNQSPKGNLRMSCNFRNSYYNGLWSSKIFCRIFKVCSCKNGGSHAWRVVLDIRKVTKKRSAQYRRWRTFSEKTRMKHH